MNRITKIFIIIVIILFLIETYCRYYKCTLLQIIHPSWFKNVNKFPKELKCKENCNTFYKNIKKGYVEMKNSKIVLTGLCINIENTIHLLKERVEYLGSLFKEYVFIIFENDSIDNTRKLLKDWCKKNSNIKLVPCEENEECILKASKAITSGTFSENRMKRMATYRNRLLDYVKQYYINYDY